MSSITLTKIKLSGYKFLSNVEFLALTSYLPGMTYFVYDVEKDYSGNMNDLPEISQYFMRADRCVQIDMEGNPSDVYELRDDTNTIIATYGTDVTFIYGPRSSDRRTERLPVGDTYKDKLFTALGNTHTSFVEWTRNGESVTNDTVIKYGDELRASFEITGDYAHPFGNLFSDTGKWTVDNNSFTAVYRANYTNEDSKVKIFVSANYAFYPETLTRNDPVVHLLLDEVFYTTYKYDSTNFKYDFGSCYKWFSPFGDSGLAIVQDKTTGVISLESGHSNKTIFLFDPNTPEYTYWDEDFEEWVTEEAIDYTNKVTTIYFGAGTGYILSVQTNGQYRTVSNSAGSTSAASTVNVTWTQDDIGILIFNGTWQYVTLGTSVATSEANNDRRPLISVPNYAQSKFSAYGFNNAYLEELLVSKDVTLLNNGLATVVYGIPVFAGVVTTVASGLNGLYCEGIYINKFASSIVANWAAGASNPSEIDGVISLIVNQIYSSDNTINLATGNSKFDNVPSLMRMS